MKLTLGALDLTASPYLIEFGSDLGAPQNVTEALAFLLQDGEVELSSRASNRTLQFNVIIEGANPLALAASEAALILETEKPLNLLTIDPGNSGPPTVYETFRAQVSLVHDDDMEMASIRRYSVEVRAYPFVRSVAEVVTPALAASGTTTTLVDNGSATTGWTGAVDGVSTSPAVVSGAVGITTTALRSGVVVTLARTGSITTSSTRYLMVDWRGVEDTPITVTGDGVTLDCISQINSPTAGYIRSWFYVPAAASVTTLVFTQNSGAMDAATARPLYVDNINRTDIRPSLGSARQLLRTITMVGSARAPGRLAIEHETAALGNVLAYVWTGGTEGYSPPMRQYRVSGGTVTTDTSKVSGAVEPIKSTTITYDIPVSRLTPGQHLLMLQLLTSEHAYGATVTTVTYTSQTILGSIQSTLETGTITVPPSSINGDWSGFAAIARLILPSGNAVLSSGAIQRITLTATTTLTDLRLDEGWLLHADGHLIVADAGAGTPGAGAPSNRMWIEPPNLNTPRPTVRVGMRADRGDAHYPFPGGAKSWQQPVFEPGTVNLLTVTTGTPDANATLAYFPRWHTHAAS